MQSEDIDFQYLLAIHLNKETKREIKNFLTTRNKYTHFKLMKLKKK